MNLTPFSNSIATNHTNCTLTVAITTYLDNSLFWLIEHAHIPGSLLFYVKVVVHLNKEDRVLLVS